MRNLFAGLSTPSFAPLIGALAADAEKIHLFLLPPKGDMPVPILFIVADWPDVTYKNLHDFLRDPILAGLEDGNAYSKSIGKFTIEGVSADTGNISYVVTKRGVWICNSPNAMEKAFAEESLPKPEGEPPLNSLLAQVSQGPVVATINLRRQPDKSRGGRRSYGGRNTSRSYGLTSDKKVNVFIDFKNSREKACQRHTERKMRDSFHIAEYTLFINRCQVLKKILRNYFCIYILGSDGRLAQFWLERLLDMQEVTGSSPVLPIWIFEGAPKEVPLFLFSRW